MTARPQLGLFGAVDVPVIVAWGAGVDSTAMIIELWRRGMKISMVLFADTGSEKTETYRFIPIFAAWMKARGIPFAIVRYEPKRFKNFPAYRTLDENALTNGTLPGISLGMGSCSIKWKQEPQNAWVRSYLPAVEAWAAGEKVIKLIGYDSSPADNRRVNARNGVHEDDHYIYRYPLRDWGYTRVDCERIIAEAGLPAVVKSACFMCAAARPHEIDALPLAQLRRIVLMEARAAPRLRTSEGLWRSTVKGCRGATPRPGSMTVYIRDRGLLPAEEIAEIQAAAPLMLTAFNESDGLVSTVQRPELAAWLTLFDLREQGRFDLEDAKLFSSTALTAEAA